MGIAFAAIFIRLAQPAPPVVIGFYRMLIASVLIAAVLAWRGRPLGLSRRSTLLAAAAGAFFGTDISLWTTSVVTTSVADATLLVNTTPVWVGLWSVVVLRERLDPRFVGGAGLALAGASVLLGTSWGEAQHVRGALLALAAGVFYAGYLLLMAATRREAEALPALFVATCASAAVTGLYGVAGGDTFSGFPASSWAAIAAAAVVSQVCGVMAIIWSLRYLPATVASVGLLGQPVGAALLAWWLLDEPMSAVQSLGALAVLAGIALAAQSTSHPTSPPADHPT